MEQITAPLPILDNVIETAQAVNLPPKYDHRDLADSRQAWSRLNEVAIPNDAPLHGLFSDKQGVAIDLLRSRLLRQLRNDVVTRLAITQPTQGCGGEAMTAQLALSLARQSDLRILVFDLNLEQPSLARLFGISQISPRQTAITQTRRDFDSSAMRVGANLGLSLSTERTTQGAELLAHRRARRLLTDVERDLMPDVILLNLPPVLGGHDVVAGADLYQSALLVIRADKTTQAEADAAERLISEQKPCMGIVMNSCRFHDVHAAS